MTANLWSLWITAARPALAGLKPGEWALLILLATSVVVLCAFRHRYLMLWTAGWALLAVGVLTTIPLVSGVLAKPPVARIPA